MYLHSTIKELADFALKRRPLILSEDLRWPLGVRRSETGRSFLQLFVLEHVRADAGNALLNALVLAVVVDKVAVGVQQVRHDAVVDLQYDGLLSDALQHKADRSPEGSNIHQAAAAAVPEWLRLL